MKSKKTSKVSKATVDQLRLSLDTQMRVAEVYEQERDRAYDDYEMAQVREAGPYIPLIRTLSYQNIEHIRVFMPLDSNQGAQIKDLLFNSNWDVSCSLR